MPAPRRRNQLKRRPWPPPDPPASPAPAPSFSLFDILDATLTSPELPEPPLVEAGDPLVPPPDAMRAPLYMIPPFERDLPPGTVPSADEISATLAEAGLVPNEPAAPIAEYVRADLRAAPAQGEYMAGLCSRKSVREALAVSDNPRAQAFLHALLNPGPKSLGNSQSVALLARKHGIGPLELTEIWRDHSVREAVLTMASRAPQVAEHVAKDALSTRAACPRCDGSGEVEVKHKGQLETLSCPQCQGRGWTRKEGSPHARDLMMRSIGVLKQGPGVVVSIDQRRGGEESVIERLERTERESGGGGGNVVDAAD